MPQDLYTKALRHLVGLVFSGIKTSSGEERIEEKTKGTACLPCAKNHFAAVAQALEEGLRFARSEGMAHHEVLRRIVTAEGELVAMERIDFSADELAKLSLKDRKLAEWALVKGRELRHKLDELRTIEDLEEAAAEAKHLAVEYRVRMMGLKPELVPKILETAEKVKAGKISPQEAVKEITGR